MLDEPVNTPLYKPRTDKAKQINQHLSAKTEDDKQFARDQNDLIGTNKNNSEWKFPFLNTMIELVTMFDGHLEREFILENRLIWTTWEKHQCIKICIAMAHDIVSKKRWKPKKRLFQVMLVFCYYFVLAG